MNSERAKHIPVRTCIGCSHKSAKHELVRIVISGLGKLVIDSDYRHVGRGAYLHAKPACLELALKANRLRRTFRTNVSEEKMDQFKIEFCKWIEKKKF